jgi:hypothetical protein
LNISALLDKLTDIELSIGRETNATIRNKVLAAQDCALELQKELADNLRKESRYQSPRMSEF